MTTQLRQPMRGTAKLPVKKAKTHQVDLFEMMGEAFNPHAVNYPSTAEPMGWASWVKAPSNEGNVP
jgi:hypothetical protein